MRKSALKSESAFYNPIMSAFFNCVVFEVFVDVHSDKDTTNKYLFRVTEKNLLSGIYRSNAFRRHRIQTSGKHAE